jgi:hypothetical protein
MIATLRLKDKNDARKICRYVAVAYPTGVRGVPAWSEQDALESLHKALAEKAAVMLSERNCKMILLCRAALLCADGALVLGGLNDFEVLAGDEGERLHVHAPI